MPTNPQPDQPLLDELTAALGTPPRNVQRDNEGHVTGLTLAGVPTPHLPPVLAAFPHLQHLALGQMDYVSTQMGAVRIVREFAAAGPPAAADVPAALGGLAHLSLATNHWSPAVAGLVQRLAPARLSLESVNYRGVDAVLDGAEKSQIGWLDVARLGDEYLRGRLWGFDWLVGLGLSSNCVGEWDG